MSARTAYVLDGGRWEFNKVRKEGAHRKWVASQGSSVKPAESESSVECHNLIGLTPSTMIPTLAMLSSQFIEI